MHYGATVIGNTRTIGLIWSLKFPLGADCKLNGLQTVIYAPATFQKYIVKDDRFLKGSPAHSSCSLLLFLFSIQVSTKIYNMIPSGTFESM